MVEAIAALIRDASLPASDLDQYKKRFAPLSVSCEAVLPKCSSHGLRKASAVTMAESGATAPELCALFGWSKLETAEIYIREARKRVMIDNAFARLDEHRNRKSVSLSRPKKGTETNRRKKIEKSRVK